MAVSVSTGDDVVVKSYRSPHPLLAGLGTDVEREARLTTALASTGVAPEVVGVWPDARLLITERVAGRPLTHEDLGDAGVVTRIATALGRLHAGPNLPDRADTRAAREGYLLAAQALGEPLPEGYLELAPWVEEIERALAAAPEPLQPCHNDLTPANLIDDGTRVMLVDFEFAAMNEASADLGGLVNEGGLDATMTTALLGEYWGGSTAQRVARAQAWALVSRYSWVPWAAVQAGSSRLDFDYRAWGREQLAHARTALAEPARVALIHNLEETPGKEGVIMEA